MQGLMDKPRTRGTSPTKNATPKGLYTNARDTTLLHS